MNNTIKFSVDLKNDSKRLDVFLANSIKQFTRSYLKKLIEKRQVKLNKDVLTSPSTKVKIGDEVIINFVEKSDLRVAPKKIKLDIVYHQAVKSLCILNELLFDEFYQFLIHIL